MDVQNAESFESNEIDKVKERQGCEKCWKSRSLFERGLVWFAIICGCVLVTVAIVVSRESNGGSKAAVIADVSFPFHLECFSFLIDHRRLNGIIF